MAHNVFVVVGGNDQDSNEEFSEEYQDRYNTYVCYLDGEDKSVELCGQMVSVNKVRWELFRKVRDIINSGKTVVFLLPVKADKKDGGGVAYIRYGIVTGYDEILLDAIHSKGYRVSFQLSWDKIRSPTSAQSSFVLYANGSKPRHTFWIKRGLTFPSLPPPPASV